jgi:4-hydroxybenzoate polyprenyltransferase
MVLPPLFYALRPSQWTKNAVVLAALVFAFGDRSQSLRLSAHEVLVALAAAAIFCLVSSGVYLLNDLLDRAKDRLHPTKRFRPIASGAVAPRTALTAGCACLGGGALLAFGLTPLFGVTVTTYIAMQIAYSLWLKRIALVDTFVIAAGFVLRALGGALAIRVQISPWLLLCTFLLALFLALCKRRHEKVILEDTAGSHRESMDAYDAKLLDQLISIVSACTIVCYAIYTLAPDTVEKFGTARLGFTVPFVLFGVFRYLDLVYRHEKGDRPEKLLWSDVPLLVNIAAYGLTVVFVLIV